VWIFATHNKWIQKSNCSPWQIQPYLLLSPLQYNYSQSMALFVSDLGVIINQNLCFHSHIPRIIAKARGRCILFLNSFLSRDSKLMLNFFTCYVRPILEYCSPIWSPTLLFEIYMIKRVQRFFTSKIPGCTFLHYSQRLAKLSLHSLRHWRLVTDLSTLFSLISGHTSASLSPYIIFIPPSVTRYHNLQIYVWRYFCSMQLPYPEMWRSIITGLSGC